MIEPRKETLADGVELWLGDCREVLPLLAEIDAVVTDPPYGINFRHSGGDNRKAWGLTGKRVPPSQSRSITGDDSPFDPSPWLAIAPVSLFWGAQHFADRLPPSRHWIVWDKRHTSRLSFGGADLAWTNAQGNVRLHRQLWNGCLVEGEERRLRGGGGQVKTRVHPMQKPVALMEFCIGEIGDAPIILDPYMGSGTTGVAAVRLGRRFIGVEIDEAYFDIARRRISEALRQSDIFIEPPKTAAQEAFAQ